MKNILFLSFLFLGIQKVQSQLIVMNDRMNIFYYGVDNPISFSVNGYDSKQLILKASCGELRKTTEGYVWKICGEKGGRVSFSCSLKKGKKIINLGNSEYRIKEIPDPVLMYTPSKHMNQSIRMLKIDYLRAAVLDFDFDITFSVTRFDLEIYKKSGDTLNYHNVGSKLNTEISKEMIKLIEGEKVCYKNVFVKNICEPEERKLKDECVIYHD